MHAQRTADGTGNAAIKLKTCNARLLRDTRHGNIERRRACTNAMTVNRLDIHEAAPEADDNAANADIAHQQVRADADHRHRNNVRRTEEHKSELQSLMRISSAVFCLIKKNLQSET